MKTRSYADVVSGGIVAVAGAGVALYAEANYALGTLQFMGPGMFPYLLGWLLCVLGLIVAGTALFILNPSPPLPFRLRSPIAITLAVVVFAFTIVPLGMIPAAFLVALIGGLADSKQKLTTVLIVAILSSIGAALLFNLALGVHVPMIRWPGLSA